MKLLLSAVLATGVLISPAAFAQDKAAPAPAKPAAAQEKPAAAPAPKADASGAKPEASAAPKQSGGTPEPAEQSEETPHYPLKEPAELNWSFSGPFGHWDLAQLQRGLKVYKEVCSNCHSMSLVAFRNIGALGYSPEQVKAFAAQYTVKDGPNKAGEMFDRPGVPSDYFPKPFPNPEAAAASLGAAPPDLSLVAKAREIERGFPQFIFDIFTQYEAGGPDYIHALLTGYGQKPPAGITVPAGLHYNPYFDAAPALAMPPPLQDGLVTYDDGAPQTVDQYARDVSAFLMWASEPHMVVRKQIGFVVMLFLIIFAGLVYTVKRRVWADTPH